MKLGWRYSVSLCSIPSSPYMKDMAQEVMADAVRKGRPSSQTCMQESLVDPVSVESEESGVLLNEMPMLWSRTYVTSAKVVSI